MMFAGYLEDEAKIAAIGMGGRFLDTFVLYAIVGMNGALETFVSHEHGAGQLRKSGQILNRASVINTIAYLILATAMLFTKPILLAFGQDAKVAEHSQTYVLNSLASTYLLCMYDMSKRFLNCFEITWVPMLA